MLANVALTVTILFVGGPLLWALVSIIFCAWASIIEDVTQFVRGWRSVK